ncbi:hypothetical protein HYU15_04110 [Candidatus Woesearchaeota archaeon]|nr:hypothetical protein [Candidatus Woesearchaeota archaeon]
MLVFGKMKLHCTNCNYQFTPKTGKMPSRCPYCDKSGTVEKVKQMQEWIDEFSAPADE